MPRQDKIGSHKTSITRSDSLGIKINYHNTCVVEFNSEKIILKNGGWYTVTTKTRMNQASNEFNLDFQVYQKNYEWFVDYKDEIIPFHEGIELTR